jgi:hypothetical protein
MRCLVAMNNVVVWTFGHVVIISWSKQSFDRRERERESDDDNVCLCSDYYPIMSALGGINSDGIRNECHYKSALCSPYLQMLHSFIAPPPGQFFCFFDDYHQMMVPPPRVASRFVGAETRKLTV